MTEYSNGRQARPRARPNSLCTRCGYVRRDSSDASSGRGSWAEKGRGLSLEVDGREGRRRNSTSGFNNGNQRGSPMHCYIVPIGNSQGSTPTSSTTYRESFRLPPANQGISRRAISAPSSPTSGSPVWPPSSSRPTYNASNRQPDTNALLSSLPSRLSSRVGNRGNTTYRDHFTWLS